MENDSTNQPRLSRRAVLQWFAAAAVTSEMSHLPAFAQAKPAAAVGYGTDPNLATTYNPGDVWPLTFTKKERSAATALADVIFPADDLGPAASEVRVPDYLDEWVSAPYRRQQNDSKVVRSGLKWLDEESNRRFKKNFAEASIDSQKLICDDMCAEKPKSPDLKKAAGFFRTFTGICSGAYFGSTEGWKAIGYVGNTPTATFYGPPQEVLDILGLEQTVKD